jgi:hypothetical protein
VYIVIRTLNLPIKTQRTAQDEVFRRETYKNFKNKLKEARGDKCGDV